VWIDGRKEFEMKKRVSCVVLVMLASCVALAQFKQQPQEEPRISDGLLSHEPDGSLFLGWFNPEKFQMHHAFSLSYSTMGGQGMSLGTYTNTMMYEFADNLKARADLSLSYSPYNSFGTFNKKNDLSSLYLSRAEINYKPWNNVVVQLQYRQIPYSYYYSPFYNPWYTENGF